MFPKGNIGKSADVLCMLGFYDMLRYVKKKMFPKGNIDKSLDVFCMLGFYDVLK